MSNIMIEDVEINDLRALTQLVKEKYNYDFSNYATSSFKRRLIRVLELYKFDTFDKLLTRIKSEPSFFREFLSEITVNVTEMFRDPSLWRELRDKVLPNLFDAHETVKIWHAGCSSGEEVFSMEVLLKESGWHERTKIFATDIDHTIIAKAKEGRYSLKNMQELNDKNYVRFEGKSQLSDYYKVEGQNVQLDKNLLSNVTFMEHNLVTGNVFTKVDIILCRNVLIYFNQNLQNEVFRTFHQSLFNYGYLIVGSKETLVWCDIANKFITVNNEEKIFKKIRD
jgi:chemotaxis protein methyltransferase CheR